MEVVLAMDGSRGRIPRDSGHRDDDGFLNPSRPAETPIEHDRGHDPGEIKEIPGTQNLKRMPRLYDLGHNTMGFDFFFREHELIIDIEEYKQAAHNQSPLREQAQRELKGNAAKESKEERRVTQRR